MEEHIQKIQDRPTECYGREKKWLLGGGGSCYGDSDQRGALQWADNQESYSQEDGRKAKVGDIYTVELNCDAGEITITHERSQKFAKATHPGLANAALRPLCGIYYKGSKVSLVDSP